MSNGPLVISAANLNTIENNMQVLNKNINSVTSDIININGKISSFNEDVSTIKNSVSSLEDEIHKFMSDIRESTLVSNAQNDILLKENELNKKYGQYDRIRHMTSGLIDSININLVKKSSLTSEREKILLNAPNYYLSYVLLAITSWFLNDQKMANSALNEALKIDNKKTALILTFVHVVLKRENAATTWLNYYLSMQDPEYLDPDFASLIEAYTSGMLPVNMMGIIKGKLTDYVNRLKTNSEIHEYEKQKWIIFFTNNKKNVSSASFPYITTYTNNYESIAESYASAHSYFDAYFAFEDLITNGDNKEKDIKSILNNIILSPDRNEALLKQNIKKDQLIIENKGNLEKTEIKGEYTTNLYAILSSFLLNDKDSSPKSKSLAVSLLKDIISDAVDDTFDSPNNKLITSNISIGNWQGTTIDGQNEKELIDDLTNKITSASMLEESKYSYLDIRIIIAVIGMIAGLFLSLKSSFVFGLIIFAVCAVISLVVAFSITKIRDNIAKEFTKISNENKDILENVLAEIVDASFSVKRSADNYKHLKDYINSFNETEV